MLATAGCVSVSSDREVTGRDVASARPAWRLPTVGGHAFAADASGVDLGAVALGCGDGIIRVWHTDGPSKYGAEPPPLPPSPGSMPGTAG